MVLRWVNRVVRSDEDETVLGQCIPVAADGGLAAGPTLTRPGPLEQLLVGLQAPDKGEN